MSPRSSQRGRAELGPQGWGIMQRGSTCGAPTTVLKRHPSRHGHKGAGRLFAAIMPVLVPESPRAPLRPQLSRTSSPLPSSHQPIPAGAAGERPWGEPAEPAPAPRRRKAEKTPKVSGWTVSPAAHQPEAQQPARSGDSAPTCLRISSLLSTSPRGPQRLPKHVPGAAAPAGAHRTVPKPAEPRAATPSGDLQSQSNMVRDKEAGGDHAAMGAGGQCWPGQYWAVLKLERPFWTFAKCCITARRVRASSGRRVQAGHGSGTGTLVCWCQGNPAWPTLTAKGFDSSQKLRNQPRKSNSKDVKHQELMFTSAMCAGLIGERWHILTQMALCAELQTHWLTLRDRAARPVPPDTLRDLLSGM